jgi:uncharacterized membrane-anchored protein YhcB (DUF1043 family)
VRNLPGLGFAVGKGVGLFVGLAVGAIYKRIDNHQYNSKK